MWNYYWSQPGQSWMGRKHPRSWPARILLERTWRFLFFPKIKLTRHVHPIQNSLVSRWVKRAKYFLVHKWSGTVPVRRKGRKPSWAVSWHPEPTPYVCSLIYTPISPPHLEEHLYEKGEGFWNQLSAHVEQQKWCQSQNSKSMLGRRGEGDATKSFHTVFCSKPFHLHQSIRFCILNLPRKPHLAAALPFRTRASTLKHLSEPFTVFS